MGTNLYLQIKAHPIHNVSTEWIVDNIHSRMLYNKHMSSKFFKTLCNTFASTLIILPLLVLPLPVSALPIEDTGANGDAFTISVNPQYPSPYGEARISLLSVPLNLANATMTVFIGKKEIYKGSVRPVPIKLGGVGSVASVKIVVASGGTNYTQQVQIQPQDVVLIAEPISSVPPLYLGKSLVPVNGDVRVVAMANIVDAAGKTVSPKNLSYAWTVGNMRVANFSGIGKSSLLVASPLQFRAIDVSVIITDSSESLVGGASLSLSPTEPSVRIYENDPLLGIRYNRALSGSFTLSRAESTLYAAPFSFPTTSREPSLEWFLNGSSAQMGNAIIMRPTGSGKGTASLSVTASSGNTKATADVSVIFGAKTPTNIFGL